jgi:proprotein convertase subtilisin/kexin type 5
LEDNTCKASCSETKYKYETATAKICYDKEDCPDGTYPAAGTGSNPGTCTKCHADCLTCSGGTASNCLTCKATGKTWLNGNTCVADCPEGTEEKEDDKTCVKSFGDYLFTGVAIILTLLTLI